jgi:hypothetical protein
MVFVNKYSNVITLDGSQMPESQCHLLKISSSAMFNMEEDLENVCVCVCVYIYTYTYTCSICVCVSLSMFTLYK